MAITLMKIAFGKLSKEMRYAYHGPDMCFDCDNEGDFDDTFYRVDGDDDLDDPKADAELHKIVEETTGKTFFARLCGDTTIVVISKCNCCGSGNVT